MPSPVPINVAVVGVGAIGRAVAALVAVEPGMRLAGLVDLDPKKIGKTLAELGSACADPTVVIDNVEQLDAVDVAIVATVSQFDRVAPTLRQLMMKKAHVVSSCEEMAWPWLRLPHLADVIAGEARKAGVAVAGAGIDPGFALDAMPLLLASTASTVRRVRASRVVNLAVARSPLRRRHGIGLASAQFKKLAKAGLLGQVGLGESVTLIAQGMGHHPMRGDVITTVQPQLAPAAFDGPFGRVAEGAVGSVRQAASWRGDDLEIDLNLLLAGGGQEPIEEIWIQADRPIRHVTRGGTPDAAAAARLVHVARLVPHLNPGLRTLIDLPMAGGR